MAAEHEELKWIRKIKLFGSKKNADSLVRSYYDEIYRYVSRQLPDSGDAWDLTQEIFISMLRSIKSYKKERSSFRTWLYRIATNKIIDCRRKKVPTTAAPDEVNTADDADFISQIAQAELLKKIEGYVNRFSPAVQQIYRLHIYGDFTFASIASALDIPEATVKSHYYRLQKKIREEFGDEYRDVVE